MSLKNFPKKNKSGFDETRFGISINRPVFERRVSGDIGIEIEMEGRGLTDCPFSLNGVRWDAHVDNSLRGDGAKEFVLNKPCKYEDTNGLIDGLYSHLRSTGARMNDSTRTSVHVHVNVQGMKINTLVSFISIWGILEDALVNWCGEYRVGNLFCLRLRDSEHSVETIRRAVMSGDMYSFRENNRYLAMNVHALSKFNSLEFRSLRGTDDPEVIKKWVQIIWKIKEAAERYSNPEHIARDFSGLGGNGFMESILGRELSRMIILHNTQLNEDSDGLIWMGMRRMQGIIYSLPWSDLMDRIAQVAIPNPFAKAGKARLVGEGVNARIIIDEF